MYTLILNKVLQYKLIVSNFTKIDSLSFKTNENINIFISQIMVRLRLSALINLPTKIIFASTKLKTKLDTILRINIPKIFVTIKTREKSNTIISQNLILSAFSKIKSSGNTVINIYNKLIFNPLIGIFFPLSKYDPKTLSELDNFTLNYMDYELF